MDGKTYQLRLIFVKLDPDVEAMKTKKILKIVANALARQTAAQASAECGLAVMQMDNAGLGRGIGNLERCTEGVRRDHAW